MKAERQEWNAQFKILRTLLESGCQFTQAVTLCLRLHGMTHAAAVADAGLWSFEHEILAGLDDVALRLVPPKQEHSLAWLLWHTARCEDVTMNLLVAGTAQVLLADGWLERVGGGIRHTGNAMSNAAVTAFSLAVDLVALRAYRQAVGRRTRQIISGLQPADIPRKVDPLRMRQVDEQGAVLPEAHEISDYWASRTIAGLLLMPATRHNFVHLNEALRLRPRLRKA